MSVRLKIITIIILSIALFGGTLYFVGSQMLVKNYIAIEREGVVRNLDRVHDTIINVSSQLEVKISDWATWDDTYEFIKDKNKAYIKSNLTIVALENLEIQGMLFYDNKGELVHSNFLDTDDLTSKGVESYLSAHENIIVHESIDSGTSGMISLPEGDLIIASKPVVTSEGKGPVGGTIVFVKKFDDKLINDLQELTHTTLTVFPYTSSQIEVTEAKNHLSEKNKHFVYSNSKDSVSGYSVVKDVNGMPILIFEVVSPRTILKEGVRSNSTFMITAGIFSLILGIFLILLIEKTVIRRLTLVGNQAGEIGESKDLEKRIIVSGKDEITTLSLSINKMLDDLKNSEDAREEVMEKNAKIAKKLVEHTDELEKFNRLMVGRELKMIELKKALREGSKMHQEKTKKKEK